jgi:hypothetical protein
LVLPSAVVPGDFPAKIFISPMCSRYHPARSSWLIQLHDIRLRIHPVHYKVPLTELLTYIATIKYNVHI